MNPYGPWLFVFAATTGATERAKGIIEWQSPNFADPTMWVLLALLLTFAALTITVLARPSLRRHFDLRDFALAAVGAGLALTSVRNTAICVAVMIPPWMAMTAGVVRSLEARRAQRSAPSRDREPKAPVMGIALVAVGVFGVGVVGERVAQTATPQGIAAVYPVVRDRHPGPQPDDAARVHRIRHRRLRHLPHLAARIGVRVRRVDLTRH